MTKPPNNSVDVYLEVIKRLEPDLVMVDHGPALTSIAISLKRIADQNAALLELYERPFGKGLPEKKT